MHFLSALTWSETQEASSRIWTRDAVSISYAYNRLAERNSTAFLFSSCLVKLKCDNKTKQNKTNKKTKKKKNNKNTPKQKTKRIVI